MALLDTLIFLTAVFLALATAVSYINEQLASYLHWRGKTLYQGVLNLVCGEAPLVEALFQHPLVAASSNDADGVIKPGDRTYRPSYIDARNFTLALHDLVANATVNAQGQHVYDAASSAITAPDQLFQALQQQAQTWKGTMFGTQLNTLLLEAQGSYDGLLHATDAWFNRQMDRVSGWYKRFTAPILFLIGFIITLGLGVDTMRIVGFLQTDAATRTALVNGIVSSSSHTLSEDAITRYSSVFAPGPLSGWTATQWPTHLLGIVITAVAAALGAPFWFDLLSSLINVRLAGPKPPSTPASPKPGS
jgi:hypothetical protein